MALTDATLTALKKFTKLIGYAIPNFLQDNNQLIKMMASKKLSDTIKNRGLDNTVDSFNKLKSEYSLKEYTTDDVHVIVDGINTYSPKEEAEKNKSHTGQTVQYDTTNLKKYEAKFKPVQTARSFSITKDELRKFDQMNQNAYSDIAKNLFADSLKDFFRRYIMGITYDLWNGTGGTNETQGMNSCIFSPSYAYGATGEANSVTNSLRFWNPFNFDFSAASTTNPVMGYTDPTNLNTGAKLISATNSVREDIPILYDILARAIRRYETNHVQGNKGYKPDVILVSPFIMSCLEAIKAKKEFDGLHLFTSEVAKNMELLMTQFGTFYTFDGVPIVQYQDLARAEKEYDDTYYMTNNQILMLKLSDFELEAEKGANFVFEEFEKIQGQRGIYASDVALNYRFYVKNRYNQSLITLPTALNSAEPY